MDETAGKLVGVLFLSRDLAHIEHLRTTSFSAHDALQKYYAGVVEIADTFAESWMGRFNKVISVPLLSNEFEGPIDDVLEQVLAWVEDNRYEAAPKSETALQNIIDESCSLLQQTIFRLRRLA